MDELDRTEAVFLIARHGRDAPAIAATKSERAHANGDRSGAKRWQNISVIIRQNIRC